MPNRQLRVLVVDDTVLYRKILSDIVTRIPHVTLAGSAKDGQSALEAIEKLAPDVVTLDVEMPGVDGLEVLRRFRRLPHRPAVILVSSLTSADARATITGLHLGAFDFIRKPSENRFQENCQVLGQELQTRIESYRQSLDVAPVGGSTKTPASPVAATRRISAIPRVVTIGVSTGGPKALATMLPQLPGNLPVPVVIVQHMPPKFTASLAEDLNARSSLVVMEARHEQPLAPGHVLIAPGGTQMKLAGNAASMYAVITDDPPENNCRPSVDYLFRSAVDVCGGRVTAVIMTGMGNDGFEGCKMIKHKGGFVISQDRESCVVYGMPRFPAEHGLSDVVAPLDELADRIVQSVKGA